MERIAMSQEERDWLDYLKRAKDGQVTQKWAAEKMGVSGRWVRRLLVEMKEKGDAVAVHQHEDRTGTDALMIAAEGYAVFTVDAQSPSGITFQCLVASNDEGAARLRARLTEIREAVGQTRILLTPITSLGGSDADGPVGS